MKLRSWITLILLSAPVGAQAKELELTTYSLGISAAAAASGKSFPLSQSTRQPGIRLMRSGLDFEKSKEKTTYWTSSITTMGLSLGAFNGIGKRGDDSWYSTNKGRYISAYQFPLGWSVLSGKRMNALIVYPSYRFQLGYGMSFYRFGRSSIYRCDTECIATDEKRQGPIFLSPELRLRMGADFKLLFLKGGFHLDLTRGYIIGRNVQTNVTIGTGVYLAMMY